MPKAAHAAQLSLFALLLGALGACGPRLAINSSFGAMYHDHFAQQISPHTSREGAPLSGDQAQRILNTHNQSLGGMPGSQMPPPTPKSGHLDF